MAKTTGGGGGGIVIPDPESGDVRNVLLGGNDFVSNEYLIYADLNKTFDALYSLITTRSP